MIPLSDLKKIKHSDANHDGLELKEVFVIYPEIKKLPEFDPNRYGTASEDMFEKIANYSRDCSLEAKRYNLENKCAVDFLICDKESKPLFYMDLEQDNAGSFLEDGGFRWWPLTVPYEKKKYFYMDLPFFYIKFSEDFKWCYVLDGWAVRDHLEQVVRNRRVSQKSHERVDRKFLEISGAKVFNRKEPYGLHRLPIQDWLKAIEYFRNMRYKNGNGL